MTVVQALSTSRRRQPKQRRGITTAVGRLWMKVGWGQIILGLILGSWIILIVVWQSSLSVSLMTTEQPKPNNTNNYCNRLKIIKQILYLKYKIAYKVLHKTLFKIV